MEPFIPAYATVFAAWTAFEIRDLRRSGYPRPALVTEALVSLYLLAGLVAHATGWTQPLQPLWTVATPLAAGAAVGLRILAFKNEEADLELSAEGNRLADRAAVIITLGFIAPAVYVNARIASPAGLSPAATLALAVALLAAATVALAVPRFSGVFRSEQERELVRWLCHPLELGGPPDDVALLDVRNRHWPDHDDAIACTLFRFRHGDVWHVGIVGPFTFSKALREDEPIEAIYEQFERFYTETIGAVDKVDADRL